MRWPGHRLAVTLFASVLVVWLVSMAILIRASALPPESSGTMLAVFPPSTSADQMFAGLTRAEARIVSQIDGRPAYGGTPSDQSVRDAILDLKARGLSVVFYPFVMMDIPADKNAASVTGASSGEGGDCCCE